jgi:hypothetical protein
VNKYEQRKAERERAAAAKHKEISEEHYYLHMTIADRYQQAYKQVTGQDVEINYKNGWYNIKRVDGWAKYRGIDIVKMTEKLLASAAVMEAESQIEHPEYLKEDN